MNLSIKIIYTKKVPIASAVDTRCTVTCYRFIIIKNGNESIPKITPNPIGAGVNESRKKIPEIIGTTEATARE
tara:strand:+ start:446 stop:664 length:219 start_codon:yes stop_codon:yes gene_type:complete